MLRYDTYMNNGDADAINPFCNFAALTTPALTGTSLNWAGFTGRQIIPAALFGGQPFEAIKFSIGASSIGFQCTDLHVEERATSGNAWDFAGTPVPVLWAGIASKFVPASGTEETDSVLFASDGTKDLILSWYCNDTGSPNDGLRSRLSQAGWGCYEKAGNEAANVAPSGFSASSRAVIGIAGIQICY